jgi:hypothetical protein
MLLEWKVDRMVQVGHAYAVPGHGVLQSDLGIVGY